MELCVYSCILLLFNLMFTNSKRALLISTFESLTEKMVYLNRTLKEFYWNSSNLSHSVKMKPANQIVLTFMSTLNHISLNEIVKQTKLFKIIVNVLSICAR